MLLIVAAFAISTGAAVLLPPTDPGGYEDDVSFDLIDALHELVCSNDDVYFFSPLLELLCDNSDDHGPLFADPSRELLGDDYDTRFIGSDEWESGYNGEWDDANEWDDEPFYNGEWDDDSWFANDRALFETIYVEYTRRI